MSAAHLTEPILTEHCERQVWGKKTPSQREG
jgi:hypothetical protein